MILKELKLINYNSYIKVVEMDFKVKIFILNVITKDQHYHLLKQTPEKYLEDLHFWIGIVLKVGKMIQKHFYFQSMKWKFINANTLNMQFIVKILKDYLLDKVMILTFQIIVIKIKNLIVIPIAIQFHQLKNLLVQVKILW